MTTLINQLLVSHDKWLGKKKSKDIKVLVSYKDLK